MTAPLQLIALTFRLGADAESRLLAEVDRIKGRGVLRVLDMVLVAKGRDGTVEALEVGDGEDFGSLLAGIAPFGAENGGRQAAGDGAAGEPAGSGVDALVNSVEPGNAVAFLLVEHLWASPLADAVSAAGGALISDDFLTGDISLAIGAEVAAVEEASAVIAEAQAAEAAAVLRAVAAGAAAAEAEAASEQIQEAAAAARGQRADRGGAYRGGGCTRGGHRADSRRTDYRRGSPGVRRGLCRRCGHDRAGGPGHRPSRHRGPCADRRRRRGGCRGHEGGPGQDAGRVDHQIGGPGSALPPAAGAVLGHRRQAGHLPVRGQGASRTPVPATRRAQPGRSGQPRSRPRAAPPVRHSPGGA